MGKDRNTNMLDGFSFLHFFVVELLFYQFISQILPNDGALMKNPEWFERMVDVKYRNLSYYIT